MPAPHQELTFSAKGRRRSAMLSADAPRGRAEVWEWFTDPDEWSIVAEHANLTVREARALMVEPEQVIVWHPRGAPVVIARTAADMVSFQARGTPAG